MKLILTNSFLSTGTIWNRLVVEIPTINFSWQHLIRWRCADIVRNSWRVSFIKATSVRYAKFRYIKDAYHLQGAVNRRPLELRHPFVIANCPNFIGLLDRCCVKRPHRNWKIVKLERICYVFGHKVHPTQMKRCMLWVSSKSSNSIFWPFFAWLQSTQINIRLFFCIEPMSIR